MYIVVTFILLQSHARAYGRALELTSDSDSLWHDVAISYYFLGLVCECVYVHSLSVCFVCCLSIRKIISIFCGVLTHKYILKTLEQESRPHAEIVQRLDTSVLNYIMCAYTIQTVEFASIWTQSRRSTLVL